MSQWRHNICQVCWDRKNPGREPHRIVEELRSERRCCYCGALNRDGIGIREHPHNGDLQCQGKHTPEDR